MSFSLTSNFFAKARGITFSDGGGVAWAFNKNTNTITATGSGGGVLSSVGFADASGAPIYTVTNSPLIANGTISITLNTQTANKVFASPTSGGAAQPTFRALVAADVPALGANPSAKVGLAAVNGAAATYIRSDGAPALDVTISPTWTGNHVFAPTAGSAIVINGAANVAALSVNGGTNSSGAFVVGVRSGSAAGLSSGMAVDAGTNSSDTTFLVRNQAQSLVYLNIRGDGAISIHGATPQAQVTGWGTPVGGAVINNYNITDAGGANSNTNKAVAKIITDLKAFGLYGT